MGRVERLEERHERRQDSGPSLSCCPPIQARADRAGPPVEGQVASTESSERFLGTLCCDPQFSRRPLGNKRAETKGPPSC